MAAAAATERRHVHLCLTDCRDQTYTVHSVDVEPLFQSSPEPDPEAMDVGVLPPHGVRFQVPPHPRGLPDTSTSLNFHLLGGDRIVSIDELRRTLIYEAASGAIRAGPMVGAGKYHTISASVPGGDGDGGRHNLYVLDHVPRRKMRSSCFEALVYVPDRDDWYWHDLPQPPYVDDPGYGGSRVLSHAVAGGGAAIWTYSDKGVGTYSFHTARRDWRKEGDWALPFDGKAEYVPSCNLWFGISSSPDRRLCAADLGAATASSPPEVCAVWEDFRPPREWFWNASDVVHLGCGRLCTVRFFATDPTDKLWRKRGPVAVITAVEVQVQHDGDGHGDGDEGTRRRIHMVRRRSTCIKLPNYNASVYWVL